MSSRSCTLPSKRWVKSELLWVFFFVLKRVMSKSDMTFPREYCSVCFINKLQQIKVEIIIFKSNDSELEGFDKSPLLQ